MLTNNDLITVPQTVVLIITTILEIGLLSLPRDVAIYANSDGWIVVIIGGVLTFVGSLVLSTLVRRFPNDTFIEYSQKVIGKVPAFFLGIVLIIYFTLASCIVIRTFAEVINAFMLQKTPREFIIITQMLLTVYLIRHGIEPTARIAEILFPILIIPIFAMYLIAIPKADFTELLPFLNTPVKAMAMGSLNTMFSFFGIEILLMLGPYMRSPERIYWTMFVSVAVSTMIYVFVVIVVFATIGVQNTKLLIWPGMTIIRTIMAPGKVFERLDALALALWTIASFTTANSFFLTGALTFTHLTRAREFKFFITILFPWIYLFASIPPNVLVTEKLVYMVKIGSITVGILIPLIILVLSIILKKRSGAA
ncbi:MAG TPA: endospore germination permease [Thermoanaerobacterales bacterium]|nr:endospore germination permease [Thermoanaerobacterales bacterium]